jgi:hypothetical protein
LERPINQRHGRIQPLPQARRVSLTDPVPAEVAPFAGGRPGIQMPPRCRTYYSKAPAEGPEGRHNRLARWDRRRRLAPVGAPPRRQHRGRRTRRQDGRYRRGVGRAGRAGHRGPGRRSGPDEQHSIDPGVVGCPRLLVDHALAGYLISYQPVNVAFANDPCSMSSWSVPPLVGNGAERA